MRDRTPHGVVGTVLSEHRTSMGLVRYRRWEGVITGELLPMDKPTAILAVVLGSDQPDRRRRT
ncbi:hypothetical protein ACTMTJ_09475 [Phytohabitans sp. LJ34]|uniref:hypothetical protein n=1 Tax=Phytohabitans sp. LJ34 TaxID=3452217 RepID=UPI003F8B515E